MRPDNVSYMVFLYSPTSHVDFQSGQLLCPLDMLLGWLIVIIDQIDVGTLQVELDSQVSMH